MPAPKLKDNWRAELESLKPDWDDHGGNAIAENALSTVGEFNIVPCGSGGVQVEIHQDGYEIEIAIGRTGKIIGAMLCKTTHETI